MSDNASGAASSAAPVDSSAPVGSSTQQDQTTQEKATAGAKEVLQKWKIKVDGKDEDVDIDTLKREYSKSRGAEKKFSEAAKMRQEAEQLVHLLKSDPRKVLENPALGINFRELAENFIKEQIEQELMDPRERQLREYERKVKAMESEKAEREKSEKAAQEKALIDRYTQEYDKKIAEALTSGGLPKTPRTVRRMAELMEKNIEYGYELEPKDLVAMVRQGYIDDMKELFGATDGDTLLSILGDDVSNKIRKSDLKRLKAQQTASQPTTPANLKAQLPHKEEKAPKKMDVIEWRAHLDKKFR